MQLHDIGKFISEKKVLQSASGKTGEGQIIENNKKQKTTSKKSYWKATEKMATDLAVFFTRNTSVKVEVKQTMPKERERRTNKTVIFSDILIF